MDDADGPLGQIAVTGQRCFALTRQGMLAECRELAVRHAGDAEARLSSATREDLAAWGGLLLWGAGASVRDNRPDDADALIRLAKAAAVAARGDFVPPHAPWHQFGPSVVAVAEAEGAIIRGRPDRALGVPGVAVHAMRCRVLSLRRALRLTEPWHVAAFAAGLKLPTLLRGEPTPPIGQAQALAFCDLKFLSFQAISRSRRQ